MINEREKSLTIKWYAQDVKDLIDGLSLSQAWNVLKETNNGWDAIDQYNLRDCVDQLYNEVIEGGKTKWIKKTPFREEAR